MKLKLFNILTALLISTYVFSTIGISVIEHYCGGELEEVAIFSTPKSCCGEENASSNSARESTVDEDNCCKNKTTHLIFHKDFSFKILAKKIAEQHFDLINTSVGGYFFTVKELPYNNTHRFIPPKIPPPKLLQQRIVNCSVMII